MHVIHVTDLFTPPGDPDDHFELSDPAAHARARRCFLSTCLEAGS